MITKFKAYITIGFFLLFACQAEIKKGSEVKQLTFKAKSFLREGKPTIELSLIKQGLIDIQKVDPTIQIDLRYSTPNNFVGIDLYGDLEKVYAQPDVAEKLKLAQSLLKKEDSTLSLLVFDAVRPLHIQQLMWDTLKMPFEEKTKFLSNPINRSVHNYGAAVDLSIITNKGEELDMGTPYDYIGKLGFPRLEQQFLQSGELSQEQVNNRLLLRKVMTDAGFRQLQTEWWHYNSCPRLEAKEKYKLIE